jgi:DNA-binding MarR family transcriptional regulator
MRRIGTLARTGSGTTRKAPRRKPKKPRKSGVAKKSAIRRKTPAENHGPGKRGENGYLGHLLRQAQAAARLTLERALADLSVTPPQFAVLTILKAHPGLSGADLARVALLTPQTTGVIIRNLERAGAIRKSPHPVHGRVLQWSLTRRGLTLLEKCRRHAMALERRLAAGLNRKDERAVRRWLSNIALTLQE